MKLPCTALLPVSALLGAACLILGANPSAQISPSAVMLRSPDVSADSIVFRYGGDIWIVPKQGGAARRVTSDPGPDSFPRFSPDGRQLAFRAGYEGGSDLYVMELGTSLPRRVTYHPTGELLCDWMPDGQGLLYWAYQDPQVNGTPRLFVAPLDGGQPTALPVPYGTYGAVDDTGTWLAYSPQTREFANWKRYQGGRAQDIWLFNLDTLESARMTDFPGTDALPMWHGTEVVFVSDREPSWIRNLFAYDTLTGESRQLTHFEEHDVKFPAVGPEDVVFENGGRLWRYEFASENTVEVVVEIPGDRPSLVTKVQDVSDYLSDVHSGPGGLRAVVEARGELFDVPFGEGATRCLTRTSGIAERSPSWSPDGRWIAYCSDKNGENEIWVRRADGVDFEGADEDGERRMTSFGQGYRYSVMWAPDSESFTVTSADGSFVLVELESGEVRELARSRTGRPLGGDWSPDSGWIVFSDRHPESHLDALFLCDVESGEVHTITSGLFNDCDPAFSADGDWLFYTSNRALRPTSDDLGETWIFADTLQLIGVPLRGDVEIPFAPSDPVEDIPELEEEAEEGEGDEAEPDEGEEAEPAEEEEHAEGGGEEHAEGEAEEHPEGEGQETDPAEGEEAEPDEEGEAEEDEERIEIELDGFEARAFLFDAPAGQFGGLLGSKSGPVYVRRPGKIGGNGSPSLVLYDIAGEQEKTIMAGVSTYNLLPDRSRALVRAGGRWGVIPVQPGASIDDALETSGLVTRIDPRAEWRQVLLDAWRQVRDFFYDPGLHGVDWLGVRERYLLALEDATGRPDVQFLIGDMMGELNVGHAYDSSPPGLVNMPEARPVGMLGCDWELVDGRYRIARILRGHDAETDARSPLSFQGVDAGEGDYLLAVNGFEVDAAKAIWAAFEDTAGKPTWLTLNAAPDYDGEEREVLVRPASSERSLRYRDWVRRCRERVDELSEGRIGYIHVPDTSMRGQTELVRQYYGQRHKQALLIDERWNGGGQVPTRFIELLNRPFLNYWAIRHGQDWSSPRDGFRGPKAMLINESAGSGGDAFPYFFRQAGLGKLIGTRTWGGLVGITGGPDLIDGSSISVPRFAFYELDGTWGIEGYGVAPDIEVIDDPALMLDGGDPQLEAAVEHLLQELLTWPADPQRRPAGPDRSGGGGVPDDDR